MHRSTVVKVQNISKIYKLYKKPIDRVKEALNPFNKNYHKDFHALDNVSFEVKRGEALGIIGRNGNGKSTLLKIIAGVLTPSQGKSSTYGKVSAILELTSSLKPELTGLENIELNLKISGFKSHELKAKIKEIEAFAEIGEFIRQPVKTYSSGMKSRLGFGIATSSEPDILILDEVLAVGDFNFKQKCLAKINSMRNGISIIFVSHSMNDVRTFCDNVLVLERGKKVFHGKVDNGIQYYLAQEERKKEQLKSHQEKQEIKPFYGDVFLNSKKIYNIHYQLNKDTYEIGDEIILSFSFNLNYQPKNLIIGMPIWIISEGKFITSFTTDFDGTTPYMEGNQCKGTLKFICQLNPDKYFTTFNVRDGSEFLHRQVADSFQVQNRARTYGYVTLNRQWNFE